MVEIQWHSQTKGRATANTNFNLHRRASPRPYPMGRGWKRTETSFGTAPVPYPTIGLTKATTFVVFGLGVSTIVFGLTPPSYALLMAAAGFSGFFLFASTAGIYATLALSFRDEARASGAGFVIGVGRISSAVAPSVAGGLFAAGFGRTEISLIFGLVAATAGLALVWKAQPPAASYT